MVSSVGGTSGASSATLTSNQMIASNFQSFLLLLTTQLKNQNPLEPLDTNQFTQQLVQFASVEQQLKTNDTLAALLTAAQSTNLSNAVGFVGKTVTADGSESVLQAGSASWNVNLPRAASKVVLTIADADNNVVWTETKSMTQGDNSYSWNGRNSTGTLASDGVYKLTVSATDEAGTAVTPSLTFSGVVEGVTVSNGVTALTIGDKSITLDKVLSVIR